MEDKAFDRPLCETMLNQKYFNGVGNYLRAEVLYRLKIRPFEKARTVLAPLAVKVENNGDSGEGTKGAVVGSNDSPSAGARRKLAGRGKVKTKDAIVKIEETKDSIKVEGTQDSVQFKAERTEDSINAEEMVSSKTKDSGENSASASVDGICVSPYFKQPEEDASCDILELTHRLAEEVVGLGFDGGYFSETKDKWESGFGQWLRCYFKDGMSSVKDHNGRTMWFQGDAGPMAPAGVKRGTGKGSKKGKKSEGQVEKDENESPKKKVKKESPKKPLKKEKEAQGKKENVDSKKITTTKSSPRANSTMSKKEKTERAPGVRRSVRLIISNDGGSDQ